MQIDFLPTFGFESLKCSSLVTGILNTLLRKCQSKNSWFFPSAVTHLCLGRMQPLDVYKPTDRAVRTHGSLFPLHTTGATLKFPSIQAFLTNGQIPEFSNKTKTFLMINETELAQAIIFVRSWMPLPPPPRICHHPVILCNSVFCLKRSHDSNIKSV
jgi:hypothetical protein